MPHFLPGILEESGPTIATLKGKSSKSYAMTLSRGTSKEGEISIAFIDINLNISLATLRGVIGGTPEAPVFWIGGLQGAKPPAGRDEIVNATRDLNGLRPKYAVLQAACSLCAYLNIQTLIAPALNNHISQRGWRKFRNKRKITADYDDFWLTSGGIAQPNGDYLLANQLPVKSLEEVKSNKRPEWRRRQQHLNQLNLDILEALRIKNN